MKSDFFLGRVSSRRLISVQLHSCFFLHTNVPTKECFKWDSSAQIQWECYPRLRDRLAAFAACGPLFVGQLQN